MAHLALLGGKPILFKAGNHAERGKFTPDDVAAMQAYLSHPGQENAIFGRSGPVRHLEDQLAAYFGRRYCVVTNSGTNALHSAYFGIGLKPGDEVIAPTNTFLATVTPLLQVGAVPVLADAERDTGNIDPADVERKITPRTRAIVVTHLRGHSCDMDALVEIAQRHRLHLVEDISLAFGSTIGGRLVGTFGTAACFSLGSTKMLSGGQGGGLVMDDTEVWDRANLVGHFAHRCTQAVETPFYRQFTETGYGHNYRMHVLAAVVSMRRLERLGELMEQRHARYQLLSEMLTGLGVLGPQVVRPGVTMGSWQGYCASYDPEAAGGVSVDLVVRALRAEGLMVSARGYHQPLHLTPFFQTPDDGFYPGNSYADHKRIYRQGDLPAAESHVERIIGFPLFLDEPMSLVERYGEACAKLAAHIGELHELAEANANG